MPTTNKRINLTVTDQVYERIEAYKTKNGITSDAAACLQLIVRQLDSIDNLEKMMQIVSRFEPEQLQETINLGYEQFKLIQEKNKK